MCKLIGAEVFVTVGSEEKSKFLQQEFDIPADHIMNSRTLEFVDLIKIKTGGKGINYLVLDNSNKFTGVDVVLNSLAGEFLSKSLSLLAPFGRFLEIGKRDIASNSKLGMFCFMF